MQNQKTKDDDDGGDKGVAECFDDSFAEGIGEGGGVSGYEGSGEDVDEFGVKCGDEGDKG